MLLVADPIDPDVHTTLLWTEVGVGVMLLTLIASIVIAIYLVRSSKILAQRAQTEANITNRLSKIRDELGTESDPDILRELMARGLEYTSDDALVREQLQRAYYANKHTILSASEMARLPDRFKFQIGQSLQERFENTDFELALADDLKGFAHSTGRVDWTTQAPPFAQAVDYYLSRAEQTKDPHDLAATLMDGPDIRVATYLFGRLQRDRLKIPDDYYLRLLNVTASKIARTNLLTTAPVVNDTVEDAVFILYKGTFRSRTKDMDRDGNVQIDAGLSAASLIELFVHLLRNSGLGEVQRGVLSRYKSWATIPELLGDRYPERYQNENINELYYRRGAELIDFWHLDDAPEDKRDDRLPTSLLDTVRAMWPAEKRESYPR